MDELPEGVQDPQEVALGKAMHKLKKNHYSSYFQGHGGPTAAVSLPTDWDAIESEIGETLAQAEIWKE